MKTIDNIVSVPALNEPIVFSKAEESGQKIPSGSVSVDFRGDLTRGFH